MTTFVGGSTSSSSAFFFLRFNKNSQLFRFDMPNCPKINVLAAPSCDNRDCRGGCWETHCRCFGPLNGIRARCQENCAGNSSCQKECFETWWDAVHHCDDQRLECNRDCNLVCPPNSSPSPKRRRAFMFPEPQSYRDLNAPGRPDELLSSVRFMRDLNAPGRPDEHLSCAQWRR